MLSSETCAFDLIEARVCIREVEPGEIVVIEKGGMTTHRLPDDRRRRRSACSSTSTSRGPISLVNGKSVYRAREKMGMRLAQEAPVEADVVIPVPDSGVPAAIGYSKRERDPVRDGAHPHRTTSAARSSSRRSRSGTSACA